MKKFLYSILTTQTLTYLLWLCLLGIISYATGVHSDVFNYFIEHTADAIVKLILAGTATYFMTIVNNIISRPFKKSAKSRRSREEEEELRNEKFQYFKAEAAKVILSTIKTSLNKQKPNIQFLTSIVKNKYDQLYGRVYGIDKNETQLLEEVLETSNEILLLSSGKNDTLELLDLNGTEEREMILEIIPELHEELRKK